MTETQQQNESSKTEQIDISSSSNPISSKPKCNISLSCFYYLPSLTSVLALVFSSASSVSCSFTHRDFASEWILSDFNDANDLDLELGIWTWRGLGLTNDETSCYAYDNIMRNNSDVPMFLARVFSIGSGWIGLMFVILAIYAAVKVEDGFSARQRMIATVGCLVIAMLEGFKFLIFQADICHNNNDILDSSSNNSPSSSSSSSSQSVVSYNSCITSSGSYFCITSIVLWIVASLSCYRAPELRRTGRRQRGRSNDNDNDDYSSSVSSVPENNSVAIKLGESFDLVNREYAY